jgi:hypothetical protein
MRENSKKAQREKTGEKRSNIMYQDIRQQEKQHSVKVTDLCYSYISITQLKNDFVRRKYRWKQ